MIKSVKIFGTLLAVTAMSLFLYSCNDEEDFKPGEPDLDDCYGVYFPTQTGVTGIEIDPDGAKELVITALRVDAHDAITVPVEVNPDYDGIFTVSELKFADGQSESTVTLRFDNAVIGVEYDLALEITDPQYASLYSTNVPGIDVSLTVVRWNRLTNDEKALYTDDIITWGWYVDNVTWEVDVDERDDMPGLFRVEYPYDGKYPYNVAGDWDTSKIYWMMIDATDPDCVFMEEQELGLDWGYGMTSIMSYGYYYYIYGGYSWAEIKAAGHCGSYKKGIITFPEGELLVNIPDVTGTGWYQCNESGAFKLALPGAADYSVNVNAVSDGYDITATVSFGDDVEFARVALVESNDIDAAVSDIKAGTIDYQQLTSSGTVNFTCNDAGIYSVVAVTYADGEAQSSGYATFRVSDPDETWTLYGTGDYHYSDFYFEDIDSGLELYQSDLSPSTFKIEHWGGDVDFYFTWDEDSNVIVVDNQLVGDTYNSSDIYVCDLEEVEGGFFTTYGTTGYYADGVFYFGVDYYCDQGDFGHGHECFVLEGGKIGVSLEEIPGTYWVFEADASSGYSWYGEYELALSDNASKGNIMFTMFDDVECTLSNVYGTYDETTGVAAFDCYQLFGTLTDSYTGTEYTLDAELYDLAQWGYQIKFLFFNDGSFWGPFYGDYLGVRAYSLMSGYYFPMGYFYLYEYLYSFTEDPYGPYSVEPAGSMERHLRTEPAKKEDFRKSTLNYRTRPVKNSAATAVPESASGKSGKGTLKAAGRTPVPANPSL